MWDDKGFNYICKNDKKFFQLLPVQIIEQVYGNATDMAQRKILTNPFIYHDPWHEQFD